MRIVAPLLRGLTLAAATKKLAARGLRLGTVTRQYSSSIPKYRILSQYPRAGTIVKRGSQARPPVNVVVSRGPQT
jgi:beta-lactam-binding protein with PASTA domain